MVWMSMFSLNDQILFEWLVTCLDILILCLWWIFLFFIEDYLGCYWSWTTIMDEDYLLLIIISCLFVHRSSMLLSYLPCVSLFYFIFFTWHFLIHCWVIHMVSNELMKSISVGVATWLDHSSQEVASLRSSGKWPHGVFWLVHVASMTHLVTYK